MIWFHKELSLNSINKMSEKTLLEHLDIKITEIGPDYLVATMPVNATTHQPFGVLHGGASCVLAESVGSVASNLILDNKVAYAVGQSITANHLRPVNNGLVTAKATILHKGKRSHLWEIMIRDENDKLVCLSTLTMAIVEK